MGRNTALPPQLAEFRVAEGRMPDDDGCGILHIDMDAFFAAVELRTRPDLVHKPVVVAGGGTRSVVLSANYLAREYGVRSAMPVGAARKLCPQAVYLPPTRGLYSEVSRGVMALFRELTPLVEPLSLDEAFLDVSGALKRLKMTPVEIAAHLRSRVFADHRITCSVGVASVKFIAKLASGMAKPDGVVAVPAKRNLEFLHPLPISALWGVGKRTEENLRRLGLFTIADVAATALPQLRRSLGVASAEHLHALANGHDDRRVIPHSPDKSIGAEMTFDVDQSAHNPEEKKTLERELLRLSERVAGNLRAKGIRGRTVSIKLRFADFRTITRSRTLGSATDIARQIHAVATELFNEALFHEAPSGETVRLIGVRVEGLSQETAPEQLSFETAWEPQPRWRDAEVAADGARSKFGMSAVRPASLVDRPGRPTL